MESTATQINTPLFQTCRCACGGIVFTHCLNYNIYILNGGELIGLCRNCLRSATSVSYRWGQRPIREEGVYSCSCGAISNKGPLIELNLPNGIYWIDTCRGDDNIESIQKAKTIYETCGNRIQLEEFTDKELNSIQIIAVFLFWIPLKLFPLIASFLIVTFFTILLAIRTINLLLLPFLVITYAFFWLIGFVFMCCYPKIYDFLSNSFFYLYNLLKYQRMNIIKHTKIFSRYLYRLMDSLPRRLLSLPLKTMKNRLDKVSRNRFWLMIEDIYAPVTMIAKKNELTNQITIIRRNPVNIMTDRLLMIMAGKGTMAKYLLKKTILYDPQDLRSTLPQLLRSEVHLLAKNRTIETFDKSGLGWCNSLEITSERDREVKEIALPVFLVKNKVAACING